MNRSDLADMLERFIGDKPGLTDWEWDDFVSIRAEPELESFRQRLARVHPPAPEGLTAIRQIIRELRTDARNQ